MAITEQQPPPIRQDLEIVPQYYRGELSYLAKDPVTLNYYKLGEVEYIVLKCFQKGMGVEQTQQEVQHKTGVELPSIEIYRFAEQLRSSSLLQSKGMEDVGRLARQKRKNRRQKIKQTLSNYLFITIPLWDPDRVLNRLLPLFRAIVRPVFWIAWAVVTSIALWIIITNFWTLVDDAFSMLSGWNLFILSVVVFSVKFIHEMGHALTCKHFGGEVHAIGPAFLIFQPCMYTDTTDAWLFPSKWDRILVTASGIIIEVLLASVAAIYWITSEPGMAKQVAYTTMMVCSISTVMFNANPLLRFDGYYVLSDLMEIPNLRAKTSLYLTYLFDHYVLGIEKPPPPMERDSTMIFLIYGVARFCYRMFLIVSIGFILYAIFPPLGVIMWATSLYGMLLAPIWQRGKALAQQYRSGGVRVRYVFVVAAGVVLIAGLWLIPIDYIIQAPCVVMPERSSVVRALEDGRLAELRVGIGDTVKVDEILFVMENDELQLRLEQARVRVELSEQLRTAAQAQGDAAAMLRYAEDVRKAREEVVEYERRVANLEVRAPHAGVVVSVGRRDVMGVPDAHGFVKPIQAVTSVEPADFLGNTLATGTGVMMVARTDAVRLHMFVPDYDREYIRVPGDDAVEDGRFAENIVHVMLTSSPGDELQARVISRDEVDVKTIENVGLTLADVGWLPVERDPETGDMKPLRTLYMVRSNVLQIDGLPLGVTGKANILYGRGPVGSFYFNRIKRNLGMRMQQVTK